MIYDLQKIEKEQINKALSNRLYRIERDRLKTRYFVFTDYPKTNYHGLNISEAKTYVYADFIARFQRLLGRNVLFSLGYNNTDSSLLNITTTLDKPLYSFSASSFITYQKELKLLEISFDEEKEILFNSDEYIAYVQQVFLFLYEKGLIKLKHGLVVFDENKVYQKGEYYQEGMEYYSLDGRKLKSTNRNYYALSLQTVKKDLINMFDDLDLTSVQRECVLDKLSYKHGLRVTFTTTTENSLELKLNNPEYICGISFVVLNPNYVDVKPFIEESEYKEIKEQIYYPNKELLFSGTYLFNPIIGNKIPIFISDKYDEATHIGIPSINEEDEFIVNEFDLEYNPIFDYINGEKILVNSGRYNGMSTLEAKEEISIFLMNHYFASEFIECELDELNISSLYKFGIPVPLKVDNTPAKIPVVYNLKHDVKLEQGELADKFLVKDFLCDEFVKYLLPNAIRLKGDIGITDFETKDALDEIGLFNKIDVALFKQSSYAKDLVWILAFNEIWRRYYVSGFDSPIKKSLIVKPILDVKLQHMHRDNNNLISIRDTLSEYGSTILRLYYAIGGIDSDSYVFDFVEVEALKELVDKIIKVFYYPINDLCSELDASFEKLILAAKTYANKFDFVGYVEEITTFINRVHTIKHISRRQARGLLIILSVITPALAEQIKEDVLNIKEPLLFYSWPD